MLDVRVLRAADAPAFATLTFPAYRDALTAMRDATVAVGLSAGGEPAGLALGVVPPVDPARGTALSILVTAAHRGQRAGVRLLEAFEREMGRRGCTRLTGSLTGSEQRSLPVERLLAGAGWQFTGPSSMLCHAGPGIATAPWLERARLPPGMEMFPWRDLGSAERAEMLERQRQHPWIPERLDPFWNEPLVAGCSVGLRYRGRLAGWCVAYVFEHDSLRWWRLFVEPELQGLGRAVPLLAETIRRALRDGYRHGVWSVSSANPGMMRLLQRRMRGWVDSARPVWTVTKTLSQDGG